MSRCYARASPGFRHSQDCIDLVHETRFFELGVMHRLFEDVFILPSRGCPIKAKVRRWVATKHEAWGENIQAIVQKDWFPVSLDVNRVNSVHLTRLLVSLIYLRIIWKCTAPSYRTMHWRCEQLICSQLIWPDVFRVIRICRVEVHWFLKQSDNWHGFHKIINDWYAILQKNFRFGQRAKTPEGKSKTHHDNYVATWSLTVDVPGNE